MNRNGFANITAIIILSLIVVTGGGGEYLLNRGLLETLPAEDQESVIPQVDVDEEVANFSDLDDKTKELTADNNQTFTFNKDLYFGIKNDSDVVELQRVLASEECYASEANGNFNESTVEAVKCFQRKYKFSSTPESGYVDSYTRQVLNQTPEQRQSLLTKTSSPEITTPPISNTATCNLDISEENPFLGCIYNGKSFDTFQAQLWPFPRTSVQTPTSLESFYAFRTDGGNVKAGYATQPHLSLDSDFSIKIKSKYKFAPGDYTFYFLAGRYDGMRVKFDGVTIIDQWNKRTYEDYFNKTFSSQTEVVIEIEYYGNAKYSGFVKEHSRLKFGWLPSQVVLRNQYCVIPYPKDDPQIGSIAEELLEECVSFVPRLENLWDVQPSLTPYLITFIDNPNASYGSAGNQYNISLQRDKVKAQGLKLGTVIHELTHIIQRPGYGFKDTSYKRASWVGEGLAEYAPYALGYPMSSGHTTLGCDGGHYREDGYRCSATFLSYVDKNYPGFLLKINEIMHTDFLTDSTISQPNEGGPMLLDAFVQHTGKSADELWLQCLQSDCT